MLRITELTLELLDIENEKMALYAREKEIKEKLRIAREQVRVKTREGKTVDDLEGQ